MSNDQFPQKQFVKYVPVGYVDTHNLVLSYVFWIFGFFGAHRFYLGRPLSGLLYLFTLGLFGIGWIVDLFLIPGMVRENNRRYQAGTVDYNTAWVLLWLGGFLGLHRFYEGKILTGILYLLTGGLFLIGIVYDMFTLNEQIDEVNHRGIAQFVLA